MKKSFLIDTRDPEAMSRLQIRVVPRPKCWPEGLDFQMRPYTDSRGYFAFAVHIRINKGEWKLATHEEIDVFHYHCEGDHCRQAVETVS